MNPEFELYRLASKFSQRTDHIQGAGGNISVKSGTEMWIKASGYNFSEIESKRGFVRIQYESIADFFTNTNESRETGEEKSLINISKSQLCNTDYKPSIETGFHALLGKVVLHTHSVYANLINCMEFSEKYVIQFEKNCDYRVGWLPYSSPGFQLSKSIADFISSGSQADVFMLQNHGIIVHGNSVEDVLNIMNNCDSVLKEICGAQEWLNKCDLSMVHTVNRQYLFPDQIIYFNPYEEIKENYSQQYLNVYQAYDYLIKGIKRLNANPKYLPENEVSYIMNMTMEKLRKKNQNIE
jgi:rhamnose utilization protein RhaD (predicted bifunctional aldolase and dehydrogenase)